MDVKQLISIDELNNIGRAEEIDHEKEGKLLREIVSNLKRTMRKKNIVSLSAPAIGYNKRIFCVDFSDKEIKTFINPIISYSDGLTLSREACTSIPEKEFLVPRNTTIDIYYETPTGEIKNTRFKDVVACVFQHEIQHLEGVTLEDIGLEIDEDFDNASQEEREEIIEMYLDSLDLRQKYLEEDIEKDDNLKLASERLRLYEAVIKGDVTLEQLEE